MGSELSWNDESFRNPPVIKPFNPTVRRQALDFHSESVVPPGIHVEFSGDPLVQIGPVLGTLSP